MIEWLSFNTFSGYRQNKDLKICGSRDLAAAWLLKSAAGSTSLWMEQVIYLNTCKYPNQYRQNVCIKYDLPRENFSLLPVVGWYLWISPPFISTYNRVLEAWSQCGPSPIVEQLFFTATLTLTDDIFNTTLNTASFHISFLFDRRFWSKICC